MQNIQSKGPTNPGVQRIPKLVLESKTDNRVGTEIVIELLVTSLHAYLFIALFSHTCLTTAVIAS